MDLQRIKKLISLVEKSQISELEITEGEEKIRIACSLPTTSTSIINPLALTSPAPNQILAVTPNDLTPAATTNPLEETGQKVKSPMVGVFYASSSPSKPPFVEIGKTIKVGDTLCIIEAMKLMNEIKSEYEGILKSILVKDGEPVEYGEPLFVIE